MVPTEASANRPRWFWIPLRVLLVTFLVTLLSFAVSLLSGILGTVIAAAVRGTHPDMTHAYRHVALPVAGVVAVVVLVCFAIVDVRRYRQARALAEIERAS